MHLNTPFLGGEGEKISLPKLPYPAMPTSLEKEKIPAD